MPEITSPPSLSLMVLAAGMGSRYGKLKQMDPMGPHGEAVLDYSVYDAIQAGFDRVLFVIRRDFEEAFRSRVAARFESRIQVDFAFQELDDLPGGFPVPAGREKPWGTAHAIHAARKQVTGPFAMINADDFYGRESYEKLAGFLRPETEADGKPRFCMIGFRLGNTLSEYGSVARGICRQDECGKLAGVTEMTKIFKTADGAENREDESSPVKLRGDELVSMNMWGFTPALLPLLEEHLIAFLGRHGNELKSESYIPSVIDELIRTGKAEVAILPTHANWFGVTYQDDKELVSRSIASLVAEGRYPENLWAD